MMQRSNVGAFSFVSIICVLTLFLVLAFGATSVIMAGGAVYENLAQGMEDNFEKRVVLAFLTNKIRGHDAGNIGVEHVNGVYMLAMREGFEMPWGWWGFVTYIYFDAESGVLREIFIEADTDFEPGDGEEIISSHGVAFSMSERYISISTTGRGGAVREARVALRAGR